MREASGAGESGVAPGLLPHEEARGAGLSKDFSIMNNSYMIVI